MLIGYASTARHSHSEGLIMLVIILPSELRSVERSMLISCASIARHKEGLTILNYSPLGGDRPLLTGYPWTACQKVGVTF